MFSILSEPPFFTETIWSRVNLTEGSCSLHSGFTQLQLQRAFRMSHSPWVCAPPFFARRSRRRVPCTALLPPFHLELKEPTRSLALAASFSICSTVLTCFTDLGFRSLAFQASGILLPFIGFLITPCFPLIQGIEPRLKRPSFKICVTVNGDCISAGSI